MVAGLVAVHVAAHEAVGRNVFVVLVVAFRQVHLEEAVQSLAEYGFAAHCLHHSAHIVGHVEGEIPGVALNESLAIRLVGVHVGLEASVGIARAGKTACGIVHIAIRLRPPCKGSRGGRIAGGLCRGISFKLEGEANDYLGKGLSGGHIADTGEYLDENCGKCDHTASCGYHYPPREFFRDHPDRMHGKAYQPEYINGKPLVGMGRRWQEDKKWQRDASKCQTAERPMASKPPQTEFFPLSWAEEGTDRSSTFRNWFERLPFVPELIHQVLLEYFVGDFCKQFQI